MHTFRKARVFGGLRQLAADAVVDGIGQNTCFAPQTGPVLTWDYIFAQKSWEQITHL
jgi:hypothetical protein